MTSPSTTTELLTAIAIVCKAFKIGRQLASASEDQGARRVIANAIEKFKNDQSPESARRLCFYALICAEAERETNPIPYRAQAKRAGNILESGGGLSPFKQYLEFLEIAERFPDSNSGYRQAIGELLEIKASISIDNLPKNLNEFLFIKSLMEIVDAHGVSRPKFNLQGARSSPLSYK